MVTPLMANDRIWGYMGIDLVKSYHEWSNEDYQWFSSLANIIGICIELRKAKDDVIREQVFLNNLFRFMPMGYIRLSIVRDERNEPCDYKITDGNGLVVKVFRQADRRIQRDVWLRIYIPTMFLNSTFDKCDA